MFHQSRSDFEGFFFKYYFLVNEGRENPKTIEIWRADNEWWLSSRDPDQYC